MSVCENCWGMAFVIASTSNRHQVDVYRELLVQNEQAHRVLLDSDTDEEPTA